MLTLLTQRISFRLGTSSAVRGVARASVTTTPIPLPSLTRRTFLTGTPRLSFAATAAAVTKSAAKKTTAGAVKKTGAKTGTKKAAASGAKAKPKAKPKKKAAVKKKPVVKKKVKKDKKPARPKLTKADMPPSKPPNPWALFFIKYIKGLTGPVGGIKQMPIHIRAAAALWKDMSDVEKQPYQDESAALKAAYEIKKQSYFDSLPPATLTEINKRRKDKGLRHIRRLISEDNRRPLSSFFRYMVEFRNSSEGQAFATNDKKRSLALGALAGQRWNVMTEAQKAPYVEAAKKDLAAWKARQTTDA